MGNSIGGGSKRAKVMKINGETMKLKTPIQACEVTKDYPDHVLLDSEAVKRFGVRAKPLEPQQHLQPKKTYFLVNLPKFPEEEDDHHHRPRRRQETMRNVPRRVQSGIQMGAKDRLELLMLSRRAVSDLTPSSSTTATTPAPAASSSGGGEPMRLKMRLPKAQLERLMEESKDEAEVADKILDLYVEKTGGAAATSRQGGNYSKAPEKRVNFATDKEKIRLNESPFLKSI